MATELDFDAEEWAMIFHEFSDSYTDLREAEKIWMAYREDCVRYDLLPQAETILSRTYDSTRLDILLAGLVQKAELRNVGKINVDYSGDEEAYTYRTLPSTSTKPVVLYDPKNKLKSNARFFNRVHKKRLEERARRK